MANLKEFEQVWKAHQREDKNFDSKTTPRKAAWVFYSWLKKTGRLKNG